MIGRLHVGRLTVVGAVAAVVGAGLSLGPPSAWAGGAPYTVYVSLTASSGAADTSCTTAAFATIDDALAAVAWHGTVVVCPGTYTPANQGTGNNPLALITRPVRLVGSGTPVLDGMGGPSGTGAITDVTITSSMVTVSGFKATGAVDEGILAEPLAAYQAGGFETPASPVSPITNVRIVGNVATADNLGFVAPSGCAPPAEYPGDCGGGIHFNAVADSLITQNSSTGNADGILLTDDAGPNHDNTVSHNVVENNVIECGITLPSHNSHAFNVATGHLQPSMGGVFRNLIADNVANGNGTGGFRQNVAGSGAGIGIFAFGPGTGAYNNTVIGNTAEGNGLSGVTLHSHYPFTEYLNDNIIRNNWIGTNNLGGPGAPGDPLDFPATVMDPATTGILVWSSSRIHVTIAGNHIANDANGIFHNLAVEVTGSNYYTSVITPVEVPLSPFGTAFCLALFGGAPCPAGSTTAGTVVLTGLVVPNGATTTYHFVYSTSPTLSSAASTPAGTLTKGATIKPVTATVTGLVSGTTYYYALVTSNSYGSGPPGFTAAVVVP